MPYIDLNIESSQWLPGANDKPHTKIIYVSPEHVQTSKYIDYLVETFNLILFVQVVVEEVHLIQTHSDFCFCPSLLKSLTLLGEQSCWMSTMLDECLTWTYVFHSS